MIDTEYKFGEVHKLSDQIEWGEDNVHFHNVFSNANGGVALVAFKKGQRLETHASPFEVMVYVVEGEIEFSLLGSSRVLKAGDFLLMGAEVAHSMAALADSKLMLVKVKG